MSIASYCLELVGKITVMSRTWKRRINAKIKNANLMVGQRPSGAREL